MGDIYGTGIVQQLSKQELQEFDNGSAATTINLAEMNAKMTNNEEDNDAISNKDFSVNARK